MLALIAMYNYSAMSAEIRSLIDLNGAVPCFLPCKEDEKVDFEHLIELLTAVHKGCNGRLRGEYDTVLLSLFPEEVTLSVIINYSTYMLLTHERQ